jgi:hypothetical protein
MHCCDAGETVRLLRASLPALRLLLPTLPALRPAVAAGAAAWGVPHCVTDGADPAARRARFCNPAALPTQLCHAHAAGTPPLRGATRRWRCPAA